MNFKLFNLHPLIEESIRSIGYTTPTPIQTQAIPPILLHRDVIGQAQTGTGKNRYFHSANPASAYGGTEKACPGR